MKGSDSAMLGSRCVSAKEAAVFERFQTAAFDANVVLAKLEKRVLKTEEFVY